MKDYLYPITYGVGFLGKPYPSGITKTRTFQRWSNMLQRVYVKCYDENPSYISSEVKDDWKNYTNFMEWSGSQVGFDNDGWHLDKDILVKGNKLYSPDTCCFVPSEINATFTKNNARRGEYPIGVNFDKSKGIFSAEEGGKKDREYLGTFDTAEEAFLAYKFQKESRIRDKANKYKDQLDPKVYDALITYQVEITD